MMDRSTYPSGSGVTRNHKDGADGAVLGDEAGSVSAGTTVSASKEYPGWRCYIPGGQDHDGTGIEFQTGADGSHGDGLDSGGGTRSKVAQLVEHLEVRDGDLSQQTGLVHHLDGLAGVRTLGGLTRQHDTIGTIQNGVGDIRHLSTSGTRVVRHGLEHLSGTDDGLTLDVTLGDHHLLGDEDLGGRDLDTKITTGNHDTVGLLKDLVEVVDTLLVLDLGNDLDLLSFLTEDLTDVADVATTTDEGREDHVDVVLDTESEIGDILLGQSGKVDVGAGKVHTLAGRDVTVVQALDAEGLIVYDFQDLEGKDTIVDIDQLARGNDLGDVLVVEVPVKSSAKILPFGDWPSTHMFWSSLQVAYFSSVVMLSSWPSLMGMSLSSVVFPVRISGPFYIGSGPSGWKAQCVRDLRCQERWPGDVRSGRERPRGHCRSRIDGTILRSDDDRRRCRKTVTNLVGTVGEVHANDVQTA